MGKRLPHQVAIYPITPPDAGGKRRVLLLRRRPGRNRFWQPVTGGVEHGESLRQAAEREFREETGQGVELQEQPFYSHQFLLGPGFWQYGGKDKLITESVYHVELPRFAPVISGEHDAWGWVEPAAALEMLYWPENRESLRRILKILDEG